MSGNLGGRASMRHSRHHVRAVQVLVACLLLTLAAAPAAPAEAGSGTRAPDRAAADATGPAGPYPPGTRVRRIRYPSTSPAGADITVTGLLLLPRRPAPRGGWPVVSWGHGTSGIGDACAPSKVDGAYYGEALATMLRRGYAVVATDYPGLGTPGVHPYLVARSEARALVDAVRAARRVAPRVSRRWVAIGHSQGGQAALASAEIAGRYGHGLDLRATVAFAPAPNMAAYAGDIASNLPFEQAYYTMMLVGLRTQHRSLRWSDYLDRRARALLHQVRQQCFPDLLRTFERAELDRSQLEPRDDAAVRRLRRWFRRNEVGHHRAHGPVLVVAGGQDRTVPPPDVRAIVRVSRRHGSRVAYRELAGLDHHEIVDAGLPAALRWLDRRR
jgi:pimeloyl-ACP methyl ester carboxylesterase